MPPPCCRLLIMWSYEAAEADEREEVEEAAEYWRSWKKLPLLLLDCCDEPWSGPVP